MYFNVAEGEVIPHDSKTKHHSHEIEHQNVHPPVGNSSNTTADPKADH